MKNTTHSNSVTRVRPALNRCSTGIPVSSGSCTTNRVAGANTALELINLSRSATRACARPVIARNRTDSGSRSARIGTSSSGAAPREINTGGTPTPQKTRAPAEVRDQCRRDQAAERRADREAAEHDHDHGGTAAAGTEL